MPRCLILLGALILGWAGCGRDGSSGPPHVILISIDTVRADHLGCYGYGRDTSPAMDELARQGVRFANAFSQSSWTLPSHMSVMTSQYPSVHGVQDDGQALADPVITLAEALQAGGYQTAAFVSWVYVGRSFGFGQGFDHFRELINRDRVRMASGGGAYRARYVTHEVAAWLDAHIRAQGGASADGRPADAQGIEPLFLFVHYFDPHMDYAPPQPYDTMFDPAYRGPAKGTHRYLSRYNRYFPVPPDTIPARDRDHVVALYDGEIRYTDDSIGRLLEAVDSRLGLDRCVVVLMSDHGEEFGDHGSMEGHGWTLYDEVLHVPLILRLPRGRHAGTVVDRPVELIDIAPTVLSLASVDVPPGFQGRTLEPWIEQAAGISSPPGTPTGTPEQDATLIFAEMARFNIFRQAVRGRRYKLIHTDDSGENLFKKAVQAGTEFFDIHRDPAEQENLFEADHPVAAYLDRELDGFRAESARRAESGPRTEEVELLPEDIELLRSLGYVR